MNYIFIFLSMTITDIVFGLYLKNMERGNILQASSWASCLTALSGIIIINYNPDALSIMSAMAGAFIGTYISFKIKNYD